MSFLGCCNLGIYEKSLPDTLTLEEKMEVFKKCGYDHFELSIDESQQRIDRLYWSNDQILSFCRKMEKTGIFARSICLSANRGYPIGSKTEAIRNQGIEMIKKAVDFALRAGIRVILIPGYDEYYGARDEETERLFMTGLCEAAVYAAGKGVVLALENIETPFMNSVEQSVAYVKKINTPYLQCYVDAGNMAAAGISNPEEKVILAEGHIAAMHLKDAEPGKFKHVRIGDGVIDFEKLLRIMREYHMSFPCVAELNALPTVEESVNQLIYTRSFLEKVSDKILREE